MKKLFFAILLAGLAIMLASWSFADNQESSTSVKAELAKAEASQAITSPAMKSQAKTAQPGTPALKTGDSPAADPSQDKSLQEAIRAEKAAEEQARLESEREKQSQSQPEALKYEEPISSSIPETPAQIEPAKWQPIYGEKGEITNPMPSIDLNKAYESQYTPTLRKIEPQPTAPVEATPKVSPSPQSAVEPVQETKWQPIYGEKGEILNPEQTIQIAPNERYTPDKGYTPNLTAVNLVSQNFESAWDTTGVDHPTGWVNNDNGSAGTRFWWIDDWHKYNYSTWSSNCARIYYYPNAETTFNDWLVTPAVALTPGATACSLTWRNSYTHRNNNDTAIVKISTDNGATWVDSLRWFTSQSSGYKKINLTAYAGQTVKVAFVYRVNANPYSNGYYWYIDDVKFFADNTTLLNENFETWGPGGNLPPSGWAILDSGIVKPSAGYNLNDWQRYSNTSWTGYCARVNYVSSNPYDPEYQNEELITPAISISSGAVCTLSMVEYYYHATTTPFEGMDHGYILVSTNGGTTWPETLVNHTSTIGSATVKNTYKYILSSHAGQSIMLKFQFVNSPVGNSYWMIDDISVDEVDPSAHNVGTVSIVAPVRPLIGNNDIKVRIRNNGINTETFRDTVKIVQTNAGTAFFSENFSTPQSWTGANPPVNTSGAWTILDSGSSPGTWNNQDWHADVFLGDTAAYLTYASGVNQNEWLITPSINCTGRTNVHLKFRMFFNWEGTTDTVWVFGTTNDWATSVQIAKYAGADVGSSSAMAMVDSNITSWAAGQSNVKIGFKYLGLYDLYCYIDDVQLFEPDPPTTVYTQSILVSGLAGMAETTLVFPQWNATAGTYELTTFTALTTDVDRTNDTLRTVLTPLVHDGTGGPDLGYYVWKDNTVVGGPTFNWVDMSAATVCTLSSYETGISTAKSLGGTFSYYGTNYDYIKIAACGTVTFDTSITYLSYSNTSIPSTAAPNAILAAYWDDMNSSVGHLKYWNDVANNRFVIQYDSLCHWNTALRVDLQIIIDRDDSSITYQYNNLAASLQTDVTIGIENPTGSTGLSYYFTSALLGGAGNFPWNGLAVKFYPALPPDDVAAVSVLNPPTTIQAGYGYPVSGIVRNGGTASQTFNVIMRADTLTSGIAGYWADTVTSVTLGAGLTDTIDFDPFTAAAIDTFRFIMKVVNPGDAYTSNDSTAYKTVYAPNVIPTHDIATVAINSPIYISEGRSYPVSSSYYNNGGNAETFTANFQMYGTPVVSVYSENFNSGLPGTWTVIDSLSDSPKTWLTSAVHDATYPTEIRTSTQWQSGYMIVDVDAVGSAWPMSEQLLTPWYNFTGYSNLHLSFSHYYYGSTSYPTQVGKVEIRQGQAGAWTNLATYTTTARQQAEDLNISAYADNLDSIQVRFWYTTTEYAWYWGIDNVNFYYQGAPVINYSDSKPAPSLAPLVRDTISTFSNLTSPTPGSYYLKTWHNLATDVNVANDTLTVPVTVYAHTGSSEMDLGYYSYKDNITGGGPAYSWKDISGTGTPVSFTIGSADDGSTPSIPLGFTFPFYGNGYSSIFLCENGFASFDSIASSTGYYTNAAIPSTAAPNNLLAFFWDDVKKGTAGNAYYYTNNVDTFIVSYLKWTSDLTASDTLDAQFILSKNDRKIKFQYRRFGPSMTLSHTIGIENSTGATGYGTQYVYNGSPMGNLPYAPLAITFSHTPPAHDVAAVSVIAPTGTIVSGTTFTPRLRETNFGAFADTIDAFFDIYFGASRVYHDSILAHPLAIGVSDTISFTPTSLVPVGAYRCTTYVVLAADSIPTNNKITSTFAIDMHFGTGGPDGAYYYWIDNTVGGGPAFSWVDMSAATVCTLSSYDTGASGAKALGGTFRFYGNNYDSVKIGANAVLTFDLTTTSIGDANYIMPTAATPNNLMAACWDDMNNRVGSITYLSDVVNNRFVVQYDSIVFYSTSISFDLQIILNWSNNTIVYQYNNIIGTLQTDYTIGIENATGTAGLTYIFDNNKPLNAFANGLAIRFYQVLPTHEIAALQFLAPPSLGVINVPVTPQVVFANNGINNEPTVPVRLLITPGIYNNTQTASIDTAARDTVSFASFTPTSSGTYTLTAIAELGTDVIPSTDTLVTHYELFDQVIDFESTNGGFQTGGGPDWEYGIPTYASGPATAHSPVNCWGTNLEGVYTASMVSDLLFEISVGATGTATLGWYQWYYYETSYDGGEVTVSTDNGSTWTLLHPLTGYTGYQNTLNPLPGQDSIFTGYTHNYWHAVGFDLTPYNGQIVQIKLSSGAEASGQYAGWYVDDFAFLNCALYLPAHDIEVTSITSPLNQLQGGQTYSITALIRNRGANTETFTVKATDNHGFTNTQTVTALPSLNQTTVTFPGWSATNCNNYVLSIVSQLGTDVNNTNDTLQKVYDAVNSAAYNFVGYDSPGIENATYMYSPTNLFAAQFDVTSPATGASVEAVEFKFLTIGDPFWPWPDAIHDRISGYIFADANNDGIPDATPLLVDTLYAADSGWTIWQIDCAEALIACNTSKFWAAVSSVDSAHNEGLAIDSVLDNRDMYWKRVSGAWVIDSAATGDKLIRASYDTSSVGTVTIALGSLSVTGSAELPGSDTVTNTIDNTGSGCDMVYSATVIQDTPFRPRYGDIGDIQYNSISQAPLGYATTSDAKGTRTEPYYPPQLLRSGGPDAYGYRYKDNDEVGGPAFGWVDITGTGTALRLTDDDVEKVAVGFSFPFYGNTYDSIYVISNGYLGFGVTSSDFSNDSIPYSSTPNNLIAIWWDDLNADSLPNIFYKYDSVNNVFIVSYVGVPNYNATTDTTGSLTFQAILYPNGNIKTQYLSMIPGNDSLSESTIGIENAAGTTGLQVVYNQAYMTDSTAILFTAPVTWLTTDLASGTLDPAAPAMPFNIFMNSADLAAGTYLGRIIVNSNDLSNPSVTINVSFTVTGGGVDCEYLIGDMSGDNVRGGGDVTYFVRYLKGQGSRPPDSCANDSVSTTRGHWLYVAADVNGDCNHSGGDVTKLVAYFKGNTHLSCCRFFPTALPPIILNTPNPIHQTNPGTSILPRNDDQAIIGTQKTTR